MRNPKIPLLAAVAFWSLPALANATRWDAVRGRTIRAVHQYAAEIRELPIPADEAKLTFGQILVTVRKPGALKAAVSLNTQTRAERGLSYGHLQPSDIVPTLEAMHPGDHLQVVVATFRPGTVPEPQKQVDVVTTWKVKANGRLRLTGTWAGYGKTQAIPTKAQ